jgi:hypothetical protein
MQCKMHVTNIIIIFCLILLTFILISCSIKTSILQNNEKDLACVKNEDCVLTGYEENSCCQDCQGFPINRQAAERRSLWRDNNCNEQERTLLESKLYRKEINMTTVPHKWRCLVEIVECNPTYYINAYCNQGTCKGKRYGEP